MPENEEENQQPEAPSQLIPRDAVVAFLGAVVGGLIGCLGTFIIQQVSFAEFKGRVLAVLGEEEGQGSLATQLEKIESDIQKTQDAFKEEIGPLNANLRRVSINLSALDDATNDNFQTVFALVRDLHSELRERQKINAAEARLAANTPLETSALPMPFNEQGLILHQSVNEPDKLAFTLPEQGNPSVPVPALLKGTVTKIEDDLGQPLKANGEHHKRVEIEDEYGYRVILGHLSSAAEGLKEGMLVNQGQQIGSVERASPICMTLGVITPGSSELSNPLPYLPYQGATKLSDLSKVE